MAVVWDDDINQRRTRWGPFVTVAVQYKWIWLNRGDGTAKVEVDVVQSPRFWDELAASAAEKAKAHPHGFGGHHA
jgi:hypothetical protein